MATKTVTIIACDVCGKDPATTFSLKGAAIAGDVDLCAKHAKALDTASRPFVTHGKATTQRKKATPKRPASKPTAKKASTKKASKPAAKKSTPKKVTARKRSSRAAEIHAWGYANGFDVSSRGRLSPALVEAFDAASQ